MPRFPARFVQTDPAGHCNRQGYLQHRCYNKYGKRDLTASVHNNRSLFSRIAENIPNEFISIHHLGILDGDKEILDGPEVEGWGDALENYSFSENNGVTTVSVEMDTKEDYVDYFNETWPKALEILKKLSTVKASTSEEIRFELAQFQIDQLNQKKELEDSLDFFYD